MSFPSLPNTPRVRTVRLALSHSMIYAGIYLFLTDNDEPGWRNILATCLVAGGWQIHPGSLAEAGVPLGEQSGLLRGSEQHIRQIPLRVMAARVCTQLAASLTYGLTGRDALQCMDVATLGGFLPQLVVSSFGRSRHVLPPYIPDGPNGRLMSRYFGNLFFSCGMEVGILFFMRSNALHYARALYGRETVRALQSWSEPAEMIICFLPFALMTTLTALLEETFGNRRFALGLTRGLGLFFRAIFAAIPRGLSQADFGMFMLFWCANTALMERIWLPRDSVFPHGCHTFPYPMRLPLAPPDGPPQFNAPAAALMIQVAPLHPAPPMPAAPHAPLMPPALAPHHPLPPPGPLLNPPVQGIGVMVIAPVPPMHAALPNIPDYKRRYSLEGSRSQSREGKYSDDEH